MTLQFQVLSGGKILGEHVLFYLVCLQRSPPTKKNPEALVFLLMAPTYHDKAFADGWLLGNIEVILMKAKVKSLTFKVVL